MSNLKPYAKLVLMGFMTLMSITATGVVAWFLPEAGSYFGPQAHHLSELASLGSTVALVLFGLAQPFVTWLTPRRIIPTSFGIMGAAFFLLGALPPSDLFLAFCTAFAVGLAAIAIGPLNSAAPEIAKVPKAIATNWLKGVFLAGIPLVSTLLAFIAQHWTVKVALFTIGLLLSLSALLAVALFKNETATTSKVSVSVEPQTRKQIVFTLAMAGLGGLYVAPVAGVQQVISTILANGGLTSPQWLGLVTSTTIPAGVILLFFWSRFASRRRDQGMTGAALVNLAAAAFFLALLPPIPVGAQFACLMIAVFLLYVGNSYEAGLYSVTPPKSHILLNAGVALGATTGIYVADQVVVVNHLNVFFFVLPFAIASLVGTLIAQRWIRNTY